MKTDSFYRNYPVLIRLLAVPCGLFIIELFIRRNDILEWDLSYWMVFLFSLIVGGGLWLLLFVSTSFICKLNKLAALVFTFPFFVFEIFFLASSYAYYLYFKEMPNYYTGEHVIQEPKDIHAILDDSLTFLHIIAFIFILLILAYLWVCWVNKNPIKNISPRLFFLNASGLLIILIYLTANSEKNTKPLIADLNGATISSRLAYNYLFLDKKVSTSGLKNTDRFKLETTKTQFPVNILIIVNESLRRQNLKFLGYEKNTSPFMTSFIDSHLEEVFVYRKAYATSTITMLSLTSILTGVSPLQSEDILHKMPLIFDYGKSLGYQTFFTSSQSFEWRNLDKFFETPTLDYYWNKEIGKMPRVHDIGTDDRFMLKEWKKTIKEIGQQPFLGVMQTNSTHYPYFFHKKVPSLVDKYDGSITFLDSLIQEVFLTLEDNNLMEKTIIIFTSDHGEAFGEHDYFGHVRTFYEEECSIPFWIYIPKSLQTMYNDKIDSLEKNVNRNISNLDIVPTVLDLLQFNHLPRELSSNLFGKSLLKEISPRRKIYMLNNNRISNYKMFISIGVLYEDFKYILLKKGGKFREELFHLKLDPKEKNNIIKLYPEKVDSIRQCLSKFAPTHTILKQADINF